MQGVAIPLPLGGVTAITTGEQVVNGDFQQACTLQINGGILCWGANDDGQIGGGTLTNRPRPTVVNSFTANVDPAVTLQINGRVAIVTALINCPAGAQAHLTLTLRQSEETGTRRKVVACEDRMEREPMVVPAFGAGGFNSGPAVAMVEALVIDSGAVLEDQRWTKDVVLAVAP